MLCCLIVSRSASFGILGTILSGFKRLIKEDSTVITMPPRHRTYFNFEKHLYSKSGTFNTFLYSLARLFEN